MKINKITLCMTALVLAITAQSAHGMSIQEPSEKRCSFTQSLLWCLTYCFSLENNAPEPVAYQAETMQQHQESEPVPCKHPSPLKKPIVGQSFDDSIQTTEEDEELNFQPLMLSFYLDSQLHLINDHENKQSLELPTLSSKFWIEYNNLDILQMSNVCHVAHVGTEGISLVCNDQRFELRHHKPGDDQWHDIFTHEWLAIVGRTYSIAEKTFGALKLKKI